MIRTQALCMRYRAQAAVESLDLHVGQGDVYGFIGPNGAGKTTTLRILATLQRPTSGDAFIAGQSVTKAPHKVRPLIGYMPDEPGIDDDMTVGGYLSFFAAAYDIPGDRRTGVVGDLLELTGLAERAKSRVADLSRGQQQRISMARALIHDPAVLLLDEPAAGLDPQARLEIRELLRELAGSGKTILISSHILSELSALCTRIGILGRGRLLFEGTIADALAGVDPRPRLEIGLANGQTGAQELLAASPLVAGVESRRGRFIVTLSAPDTAAADVARLLLEGGCDLEHLTRLEPDLEDAFLAFTDEADGDPLR